MKTIFLTLLMISVPLAATPTTGKVVAIPESDAITIPRMLSYQGKLLDAGGNPVTDTTYSVLFSLYTVPGGGGAFWSETQTVRTGRGLFSVLLGSVTPIATLPDAGALYLGMKVGADPEMTPRLRIVSSAYAYLTERAANADLLQGRDTSYFLRSGQPVPSDDWVRGAPDSVLYTIRRLGIARGGSNNMLHGSLRETHVNLGVSCTTGTVSQTYGYATVGGGSANVAARANTTVGGGLSNAATGTSATVGGGNDNAATGDRATVGGGNTNSATGSAATVGGGQSNMADTTYALVGGGYSNDATGYAATVGGGYMNLADLGYATVGGGRWNAATNSYATVGGGSYNTASGDFATVAGGRGDTAIAYAGAALSGYGNVAGNAATDTGATVAGGYDNSAIGAHSFIGGGSNNNATNIAATVGGGSNSNASGSYATVAGGRSNTARAYAGAALSGYGNVSGDAATDTGATVAGGYDNSAIGVHSFVGGGWNNNATGLAATVAGGQDNTAVGEFATIAGGVENYAGTQGAIPGGYQDTALGTNSFAAGWHSKVASTHLNAAAFTGSHTTASAQIRAQAFSTGSGVFSFDHPQDPLNRILNQYAVGSAEQILSYRGAAVIGPDGRKAVSLPAYFDALNRNPMVQLTGVGTPEPVYVAEDVGGNRFVIGGKPGTKVYWTVTGERKDQSAEIARILTPVEQAKAGSLVGHSLDDDGLANVIEELEQKGLGGSFRFRTAAGQQQATQARLRQ